MSLRRERLEPLITKGKCPSSSAAWLVQVVLKQRYGRVHTKLQWYKSTRSIADFACAAGIKFVLSHDHGIIVAYLESPDHLRLEFRLSLRIYHNLHQCRRTTSRYAPHLLRAMGSQTWTVCRPHCGTRPRGNWSKSPNPFQSEELVHLGPLCRTASIRGPLDRSQSRVVVLSPTGKPVKTRCKSGTLRGGGDRTKYASAPQHPKETSG
jgi:hypothetical protein